MEVGMTPEESLFAFHRACTDKMMRLMPVMLRNDLTGDIAHARPIKHLEVQAVGDTYQIHAEFYDGRRLTNTQSQVVANASPVGAANAVISGLMRAKQSEFETA